MIDKYTQTLLLSHGDSEAISERPLAQRYLPQVQIGQDSLVYDCFSMVTVVASLIGLDFNFDHHGLV